VTPRASVAMPAHDAEPTLRDAVESVLAQSVGDLELLVVDDASGIPVREVLADVHDARLRIIRRARQGGTARGRNSALRRARAPVVCQLDADDLWEPDYLAEVLPAFDDPSIGLAYSNATIVGHPDDRADYIGDPSIHPRDRFPELALANPVPCPTAAMRTEAVRAVGGYAGWLRSVEDWHLYMRLAARGWRFAYVDRQLARYRWPSAASGMSYDARRLERWVRIALADFALRHPRTPGVWQALARRLRSAADHGAR
jgi:cellulose synthase/poly-beta-1,6-N-acetylglucosamine synthase-like glycosyltransferase